MSSAQLIAMGSKAFVSRKTIFNFRFTQIYPELLVLPFAKDPEGSSKDQHVLETVGNFLFTVSRIACCTKFSKIKANGGERFMSLYFLYLFLWRAAPSLLKKIDSILFAISSVYLYYIPTYFRFEVKKSYWCVTHLKSSDLFVDFFE